MAGFYKHMHTPNRFAIEYNEIVTLYHNETDRGAGVLAPAFVDQCLENSLRTLFVNDPPFIKQLFEENGPLSTSYQKASMAFALGLITKDMWEDLKYLRKIRNKFAHVPSITSFDKSPVREWCSNLSMAKPIPEQTGDEFFQETRPRFQFLFTIGMLVVRLDQICELRQQSIMPTTLPPRNAT